MSGVYIKGMEMPTKQVLAVINPDGLVEILNSDNILVEEFYAVSVPVHGRLIDENALLKGCGYIIADGMACIPVKYIANAPTIIEAEEGE